MSVYKQIYRNVHTVSNAYNMIGSTKVVIMNIKREQKAIDFFLGF